MERVRHAIHEGAVVDGDARAGSLEAGGTGIVDGVRPGVVRHQVRTGMQLVIRVPLTRCTLYRHHIGASRKIGCRIGGPDLGRGRWVAPTRYRSCYLAGHGPGEGSVRASDTTAAARIVKCLRVAMLSARPLQSS